MGDGRASHSKAVTVFAAGRDYLANSGVQILLQKLNTVPAPFAPPNAVVP